MKRDFSCVKEHLSKTGRKIKNTTTKYHKAAGAAVVAVALCAVCTVSLTNQFEAKNQSKGVMISLAEVKESRKADASYILDTSTVTYAQMQDILYDTNQLAMLETSEKQIEAILASPNQDEKDQAAVFALIGTPDQTTEETYLQGSYEEPHVHEEPVVYKAPEVVTYADENGTYEYQGEFELTAYCACPICCGSYSNMQNPTTASGTRATAGRTIAADISIFPFGTELVINGQVYVVEDTGGAINGNRIDVFFNSHEEALIFGRQYASVFKQIKSNGDVEKPAKAEKIQKSKKRNK